MTTDLENSIRKAAATVAQYVEDIAEMRVDTHYVEIASTNGSFDQTKLAARTVVKIDGDSESVIPMRQDANQQMEIDTQLYGLHQQNVRVAIEYRAKIMDALLGTLNTYRR